ncbi:MAG: hypothetical protein ABIY52_06165, partial [Gemmatimonadaceae bacterium]
YRYHDRMVRGSAEYRLPLAYPDLALGSVLYVKRLQGEVFHDRAVGSGTGATTTYSSSGVELTADLTPFSWSFLGFAGGVRYVHRAGLGARVEPVLTIGY